MEEDNSFSSGTNEELSFSESPPPEPTPSASSQIKVVETVRILKQRDLEMEMVAEIKDFAQVSCIPPGSIRIVLDFFKWDKEKILEKTLYGESFLLLRDMGIIVNPEKGGQQRATGIPHSIVRRQGDCLVCHRRPINSVKVLTACDHWFCIGCFQRYLRSEIESGYSSHFKCPYNLCRMFLDDSMVVRYMPPGPLFDAFRKLRVQDFIKCSKYRQMCPTIDCNRSAYLDVDVHTKKLEVQCECGAMYCFGCGESWHFPLTCEQLQKWVHMFRKIPDFSTVVNIQKYKMPCPHCSVTINNAANFSHITCPTCNFMFCWNCLHETKWDHKNGHTCSSHLNSDIEPEILGFAAIQRDFEILKEKFSAYDDVDLTLKNLDESKLETTSANLTDRVCDIIVKSQQLVRHAYVFTYFLHSTLMKYRFFKLLHKFESHLDTLMEEFESLNETSMTRLELEVRKERDMLLHTISDGIENDLWHFKKFQDEF